MLRIHFVPCRPHKSDSAGQTLNSLTQMNKPRYNRGKLDQHAAQCSRVTVVYFSHKSLPDKGSRCRSVAVYENIKEAVCRHEQRPFNQDELTGTEKKTKKTLQEPNKY